MSGKQSKGDVKSVPVEKKRAHYEVETKKLYRQNALNILALFFN